MSIRQHQIWKTRSGMLAWLVEYQEYEGVTYPYYGIICDEFADDIMNVSWTKEGYYRQECVEHPYDLVEIVKE